MSLHENSTFTQNVIYMSVFFTLMLAGLFGLVEITNVTM